MHFDATFFAFVGLVLFLALVVYLKVPGMMAKSLDARADKIRDELAEAKQKTEEFVARRNALSEQKIKQAETAAVNVPWMSRP